MAERVNRRNYYRILHVQPDAPVEIIRASYRTLMHKLRYHPDLGGDDWNAALLNEALQVLSDDQRRAAYDRECLPPSSACRRDAERSAARGGGSFGARASSQCAPVGSCPFCGSPLSGDPEPACPRCRAPLSPPQVAAGTHGDQRRYARLVHAAPLLIHTDWSRPEAIAGQFRDLSPAGVQAAVSAPLAQEQIVLLTSELLDAVGKVANCSPAGSRHIAGIAFLTLRFHEPRGTFVSARV